MRAKSERYWKDKHCVTYDDGEGIFYRYRRGGVGEFMSARYYQRSIDEGFWCP